MGANDSRDLAHRRGPGSLVDAFLDDCRSLVATGASGTSGGRLVFALDATMSRQPTWDLAQNLQGRMFQITESLGGLSVQLMYFRGFRECRASDFVQGGQGLAALMGKIDCRGGRTQIGKVLRHVVDANRDRPVRALVFVGDAMEERADDLCDAAGRLGLLGIKAFMFHEGHDHIAAKTFSEIARLTGGAYAAFDTSAPQRLSDLLAAAARYAAGGLAALTDAARNRDAVAQLLLSQITE